MITTICLLILLCGGYLAGGPGLGDASPPKVGAPGPWPLGTGD